MRVLFLKMSRHFSWFISINWISYSRTRLLSGLTALIGVSDDNNNLISLYYSFELAVVLLDYGLSRYTYCEFLMWGVLG